MPDAKRIPRQCQKRLGQGTCLFPLNRPERAENLSPVQPLLLPSGILSVHNSGKILPTGIGVVKRSKPPETAPISNLAIFFAVMIIAELSVMKYFSQPI
jgi:hypothetical protein